MDPYSLFWIEAILMNFAELKRWQASECTQFMQPGACRRGQRLVSCTRQLVLTGFRAACCCSRPATTTCRWLSQLPAFSCSHNLIRTLLSPPPRSPQDFKEPGSQSKQYFLGLEAVFGGSGNPAYPGGQASAVC